MAFERGIIDTFKFTVIGAGVIGLAIAAALTDQFKGDTDVLVLEKEGSFGKGTSSRNSEVIHSGIYYPTDSLKHNLCIQGRRMLYEYCERKKIPFNKCGKLVIATENSELELLEHLHDQAMSNGVENVLQLSRKEALALEPGINVVAALFSRETGIFDSHSFMKSLEADINRNNGTIVYGSRVVSISYEKGLFLLTLADGTRFTSESVINSAGLQAAGIASSLGVGSATVHPCKGTYFSYIGKHRVKHLIYPVPHKSLTGLGVHATLDMGGRLKFGPDAEYIDSFEDYSVDKAKTHSFFESARKIFTNIQLDNLLPDMAGIRPKLQGPGEAARDFYIKDEAEKGFPRFINLLGMESPGLTSALAIADYVHNMLR